MAVSGTYGYNDGMTQLRFAPRHPIPPFMCEAIKRTDEVEPRLQSKVDGFFYTVNKEKFSALPVPSYEKVRLARPLVVKNLRAFHESFHGIWRVKKLIVYAAVNKLNNKIYIGMTRTGLSKRRTGHAQAAARGKKSYFCAAIRKYGIDGFDWLVLAICRDVKRLNDFEKNAIASIMPEYNMTAGGDGGGGKLFGTKSIDLDAVVIEKQDEREPKKPVVLKGGKRKSVETKQKMSDARKRWWENRKRSDLGEAYKEKLLRAGKIGGMAKARKVICITDNNRIFDSVISAARYYGVDQYTVIRSCKKKGSYKYKPKNIFVYVDDIK
jgi:group I intron endonuclease